MMYPDELPVVKIKSSPRWNKELGGKIGVIVGVGHSWYVEGVQLDVPELGEMRLGDEPDVQEGYHFVHSDSKVWVVNAEDDLARLEPMNLAAEELLAAARAA